jgi:hypothetical protein
LRSGHVQVDLIKCPAWPALIAEAQRLGPVYIHFPLVIGAGQGVMDVETRQGADWDKIEQFLSQTGTRYVNAHLAPKPAEAPDIPIHSVAGEITQRVIENTLNDLAPVIQRFGAEHVIVENSFHGGTEPLAFSLPEVIATVVRQSGCGFLLDLSHARLAAPSHEVDERAYLARLPVERIREMHVTGLQVFDEIWINRLRQGGADPKQIARFTGRRYDHLPLLEEDWNWVAWAIEQIHTTAWRTPEIVAFEYGGVGNFWAALSLPEVLEEQIPRLYQLVHQHQTSQVL